MALPSWLIAAAALALAACTPNSPPPAPSGPPPGSTGVMCGGIAGFSCTTPGEYCRMPPGQCRVADAAGTCEPKPDVCTEQYQPVCGCNGKTYGNECNAAQAGVSVAYTGECKVG